MRPRKPSPATAQRGGDDAVVGGNLSEVPGRLGISVAKFCASIDVTAEEWASYVSGQVSTPAWVLWHVSAFNVNLNWIFENSASFRLDPAEDAAHDLYLGGKAFASQPSRRGRPARAAQPGSDINTARAMSKKAYRIAEEDGDVGTGGALALCAVAAALCSIAERMPAQGAL